MTIINYFKKVKYAIIEIMEGVILMHYEESEVVELKSTVTDEVKAEIVAFLNSNLNGTIYIGVDDFGKPLSFSPKDLDKIDSKIINWIRDEAIYPNCSNFIKTYVNSDNVLVVEITPGIDKPYYLKEKGLKPSGVYVRYGRNKSQATQEEIKRMIKESSDLEYEALESKNQQLTFRSLELAFEERNKDFKAFKMITSGFINSNNKYTNLAFIFSDQYNIQTKVAVYQGLTREIFKSKKEFEGSIIKQISNVIEYSYLCNETRVVIDGEPQRKEYESYNKVAVREAILNCYCHRDYSRNSNIKIEFFDDRCELISPGGFYDGLTLESALKGVQTFRNRNLVRLLYDLNLIENYASGLERIFSAYKDSDKKPIIEDLNVSFKVTLPNMNYRNEIDGKKNIEYFDLTKQEKTVLDFLETHESLRRTTVEDLLGVGGSRAGDILQEMMKKSLIYKDGSGPGTKYYKY